MRSTEQSEHLTLRLPAELRGSLERAAAADRRPVSSLIRNVLSDWLAGRASHDGDRAGRSA
jgi:predicted transcriptional regulator